MAQETEKSVREQWLKDLQSSVVGPHSLRASLPRHVLEQAATLLGLQEVKWASSSVVYADSNMTGEVVV